MRDETQETVNSLHHRWQKWFGRRSVEIRPFHFTQLFVDSTRQQMTDDRSCTLVTKLRVSGPFKSDDTYFLTPMFVRGVNVITAVRVFSTSINELLSQLTWLYSLQSEINKLSTALQNMGLNAKKEPTGCRLPMPPVRDIWIARHHHHHHHIIIIIICLFYVTLRPNAGHGLLINEVPRSHTTTHHSR